MSESLTTAQTSTPVHPVSIAKIGRPPRPSFSPAHSPAFTKTQSPSHTQSSSDIKQEDAETSETQEQDDNSGLDEPSATQTEGDSNSEQMVKVEPMTESELDLEITGIEMGDSSSSNQMGFSQQDWSQQGMSFSESGGVVPEGAEGYDSGSQSEFGNSKWIYLVLSDVSR